MKGRQWRPHQVTKKRSAKEATCMEQHQVFDKAYKTLLKYNIQLDIKKSPLTIK